MLRRGKTGLVCGVRKICTSIQACASHYDVLGVTPKSSQSDIKAAYYKLSKVYHPDKSDDEASAKKFRAITEAYEVLGNVKLKNMYDRGFIRGRDASRITPQEDPEPTDPTLKFYKSRSKRTIVPTMDGKQPIYDFDAWAKNHYSTLYEKSQYDKAFVKRRQEKQEAARNSTKQDMLYFVMIIMTTTFFWMIMHSTADYDQNRIQPKQNASINNDNN